MSRRAVTLLEAMVSLALFGLVLAVVAEGFRRLQRLNRASSAYSERLEVVSLLHAICQEASAAVTLSAGTSTLALERVDPSLNQTFDEPRGWLPWHWPVPPALPVAQVDPHRDPYRVKITFHLTAAQLIRRLEPVGANPTRPSSSTLLDHIQSFRGQRQGRLLRLELVTEQANQNFATTAYLAVARP